MKRVCVYWYIEKIVNMDTVILSKIVIVGHPFLHTISPKVGLPQGQKSSMTSCPGSAGRSFERGTSLQEVWPLP